MARDILKKVYDTYINEDYSLGTDNLNPKREIKKTSEDIWNEKIEAEIYNSIKAQLDASKEELSRFPIYKNTEAVDNNNFKTEVGGVLNPGESPDIPESLLDAIYSTGGDTASGKIFYIPSSNQVGSLKALSQDIDNMLLQLLSILGERNGSTNLGDAANFLVDCSGITYASLVGDEDYEDVKSYKSNNSASNNTSNDPTKVDYPVQQDSYEEDNTDDSSAEEDNEFENCALNTLEILKAIQKVLEVVMDVKNVVVITITIISRLVKVAVWATQIWINPPAAAKLIQDIAEEVYAILLSMVSFLLQSLWNLLHLDCVTESIQGVLDLIKKLISGVVSTVKMSEDTIEFATKEGADLMEFLERTDKYLAERSVDEARNNWLKERDKVESIYNNFVNQYGTADGIKKVLRRDLPPEYLEAYDTLKEVSLGIADESMELLNTGTESDPISKQISKNVERFSKVLENFEID